MNGHTIHHWSGIPARNESGSCEGASHQLSIKCQALRVIIIHEVSMVSAELLGALQYVVTKAVRFRGTFKKRRNGGIRAFVGVNLVMCGDFWRLHPVSGIFLVADFTEISPGRAADALTLLGLKVVTVYAASGNLLN